MSRLTKISALYLDYIEKDQFDKLPQGPYAKGYIASYSRLIGGNVDEAIQLYESLNGKRTPTEASQPETSIGNGRPSLPETPEEKPREQPGTAAAATAISFFHTVATCLKARTAAWKTAIPSLKGSVKPFRRIPSALIAMGSGFRAKPSNVDAAVAPSPTAEGAAPDKALHPKAMAPMHRKTAFAAMTRPWISDRRTWLIAGVSLFGTAILVLAGFGFYHLFIYDPNPLSVGQSQKMAGRETAPPADTGAEKAGLPSRSNDTSLSSRAEAAAPRNPLKTENQTGMTPPTPQPGTRLSGTASIAGKNDAPGRSTAVQESPVRPDPGKATGDPVAEATAVDAHVSVLQASTCSEIINRMPAGVGNAFPSSTQRVYVWNAIEARRIPSSIRHIYYLNGRKIGDVTLDVRAPYWRTWSYKNITDDRYRGEWRVDIASADAKVLRRLYFTVK